MVFNGGLFPTIFNFIFISHNYAPLFMTYLILLIPRPHFYISKVISYHEVNLFLFG